LVGLIFDLDEKSFHQSSNVEHETIESSLSTNQQGDRDIETGRNEELVMGEDNERKRFGFLF